MQESKIKLWKRKSFRKRIWKIAVYIILVIGGIIVLIPFAWMISTALKPEGLTFVYPPQWIPKPVMWTNFYRSFTIMPFVTFYKNTAIITISCMAGTILSSSLVAFSFARLRFPGRDILFLLTLSTMMVPFHVTIIPRFLIFRYLNWIDTLKPLIVPSFFGSAFNIFLLRQFFMTIPIELDDAAKIDGCSTFAIFSRIILPLSKPALGIVAIFTFMGQWNSFLNPLIYLSSEENFTISLGLNAFRGLYTTMWNLLMMASFLALLPCLVLFFFTQKHFIQGIVITGVKG